MSRPLFLASRQSRSDFIAQAPPSNYLLRVSADTLGTIVDCLGPVAVANLRRAIRMTNITDAHVQSKVEDIMQHWFQLTEQDEKTSWELCYEIATVRDVDGNTALHRAAFRMAELAPRSQESLAALLEVSRKCLMIRECMTDLRGRNHDGQTAEDILRQAAGTLANTYANFDIRKELSVVTTIIGMRHDEWTWLRSAPKRADGVAYVLETEEDISHQTPLIIFALKRGHRKFALNLLTEQIRSESRIHNFVSSSKLSQNVTQSLGLTETDIFHSTAMEIALSEGYDEIARILRWISRNTKP